MPKTITPMSDELKSQWMEEKNLPLTIDSVSAGSNKKVWWKCEKGHEWEAVIKGRSHGNGCPYCSGRLAIQGETDFGTLYPLYAQQWHPTKNGELTPSNVTPRSAKKVWWQCEKGHEWEGSIVNRNLNDIHDTAPCAVCLGNVLQVGVNDFASLKPELVKFWSNDNPISPQEVTARSNKKVVWECEEGHKFKAAPGDFTHCSLCSGRRFKKGENDIASTYPELMSKWDASANDDPTTLNASRKSIPYFWLCEKGHQWKVSLSEILDGKQCSVCEFKIADPRYNTLDVLHPEIAKEWDTEKNDKSVQSITPKSYYSAWWVCPLGHSWRGLVTNRVKGTLCPVCEGREVLSGFNDLSITHPDFAEQFSPKNDVDVTEIGKGSSYRALWECEKGHEWEATVASRIYNNSGCPYCSVRKFKTGVNDLLTLRPDIAQYWSDKNEFSPSDVSTGYSEKVWWECDEGHEYQMSVILKTSSGFKCPLCSGRVVISGVNDVFTILPDIAQLWSKKNTLDPTKLTVKSNKRAIWECDKGHEWEATVQLISEGRRCPFCANKRILPGYNDVFTAHPHLKDEWDFEKNAEDGINPEEYSYGSKQMAWWKCDKGHSWKARILGKKTGEGCPECAHNISRGEIALAEYIRSLGFNIETRNRSVLGGQELDIFVPNKSVAFEFNGVYWHSEIYREKDYHYNKYAKCREQGIRLIQVWEDDWENSQTLIKRMVDQSLNVPYDELSTANIRVGSLSENDGHTFLNQNHLQGTIYGGIFYGLFDKDECISVLNVRFEEERGYITRYATSKTIPEGFTTLLKYVEQASNVNEFYTFSDNQNDDGELYARAGFVQNALLPPSYTYDYKGRRENTWNFRKSRFETDPNLLYEEGLSESELAELNGIHRVYDSGKIRWVKRVRA